MEKFLTDTCLKSNGKPVNRRDFKIQFGFPFLAPRPRSQKVVDSGANKNTALTLNGDIEEPLETPKNGYSCPETEHIWHLGQSSDHCHLLLHPVIALFIRLKWKKVRDIYRRSQRFGMLFVTLLTWHIFSKYGDENFNILDDNFAGMTSDSSVLFTVSAFSPLSIMVRKKIPVSFSIHTTYVRTIYVSINYRH